MIGYKNHLRNEIFSWMVYLCILQAVVIGSIFFWINSKTLFENEKQTLEQLIGIVNQDLESKVEAINSLSFDLVINNELKNNLNKTDSLEVGRAKKMINDILSDKVLSVPGLADISILDREGNAYANNTIFQFPQDFDITETDAYKEALKGNGELVWLKSNNILDEYASSPYATYSNIKRTGLNAIAVIKDFNRGEILGLLMITLKDNYFYQLRYSSNKLKNVQLYLVSPDKERILPVAGTQKTIDEEILSKMDVSLTHDTFIFNDTKKNMVSYVKNNAMGWTFLSISSVTDIKSTYVSLIKILPAILLLSIAASMFVAWRSTLYITRGVNELVEKMHLLEKGDFDIHIDSVRNDEIGLLSDVFNKMVIHINRLIESKYKQELLTKDAEFRVLQAQISPHFLNNTLDMINWKLLEVGQTELGEYIQALGQLFQYSFSKDNTVDFKMEIRHVEDYIVLWQASQNPSFTYERDIEGGMDVLIPKLTLQPLVENAVLHGFGRRKKGNILKIRSYFRTPAILCIEVIDNGLGMDDERISEIQKSDALIIKNNEKIHLGIKNVEQRLKYMYGPKSMVDIISSMGIGTTVRLIIPLQGDWKEGESS